MPTRTIAIVTLIISLSPCAAGAGQAPAGNQTLTFSLRDTYGRPVSSVDYVGAPVLIEFGACWCGGCQEGAAKLRQLAVGYGPRGVQVIHCVAGDNELGSVEYQKHYRFGFLNLLDPNREFEKTYNHDGWPFIILADSSGKILHAANSRPSYWSDVQILLNDLVVKEYRIKPKVLEGIPYMPATLERTGELDKEPLRRDRFPSVACGVDGRACVAFTTNRNGNEDIFARVFDGKSWSEDFPVAATKADEYDGTVLIDAKNRLWFSWTSNADGNYNVFVASSADAPAISAPEQVTDADDDAMHARMAETTDGKLWLTYYRWLTNKGVSRDREIYVRCRASGKWSRETQVSPTDVPWYEDHCDPVIRALGGDVVIAWSWDFHQPKGYTSKAQNPTIFTRTVTSAMKLGPVRPVSGSNIDTMPSIAADSRGALWCAWESIAWDSAAHADRKGLCVAVPSDSGSEGQAVSAPLRNVCTPRLALSPSGVLTAVWAEEKSPDRWTLRRSTLDLVKKEWSEPETILSDGNPRFPSISFDSSGALWVAYSADTKAGIEVVTKSFPVKPAAKK